MKYRNIIPMLLLLAMFISMFGACGSQSEPAVSDTGSAADAVASAPAAISAEEPEVSTAPAEMPSDVEELDEDTKLEASGATVELPLVDTPTTITYWAGGWDGYEIGLNDPNEVLLTQEYENRTGIHVEYTTTSFDANDEQTSLMFASGDFQDLIPLTYNGGLEKGVEDDVYLLLNDIIEENAPNYTAIRKRDASVYKDSMTDTGHIIAIYDINTITQPAWYGLLCRADYLEDVGMDVPVTYDDMHVVLTAFKNQLGLTSAYKLSATGYSILGQIMMAGFDVVADWYQIDGQALYGPMTDNFRQYLETMNQWYEEGLISSDFISSSPFDDADIMSGNSGVFAGDYTACTNYAVTMGDGARVIAIPEPVINAGDTIHVGQFNTRAAGTATCISTTCEDPELVLRWLDYAFTEEGSLLCNYGIEGETFYYDENGKPQLSELITNNPDGLTFKQALSRYVDMGPGVSLYDWTRELNGLNQDSLDALEIWDHDGAHLYPEKTTPTTAEGEAVSAIMSDIETYVSNMILQFITGQTSFDQWDAYVDYIEASGIDEAISIKQDILDRYNNR